MSIEERIRIYRDAFDEAGGTSVLGAAELEFFAELLHAVPRVTPEDSNIDPAEVAWGFESLALNAHTERALDEELIPLYEAAYRLRASGWSRKRELSPIDLWMLIVSGLGSQRQPELRLTLQRTDLDQLLADEHELDWAERVWRHCVRSFALLARKASSWADIDMAQAALRRLAELQHQLSPGAADEGARFRKELGLYHVAEALATLGSYLRTGAPQNVQQALRRHSEHARFMLASIGEPDLELAAHTLEPALAVMANASIWANTSRLSEAARTFARRLAADDATDPVSELWYSQRQALTHSLLDPVKAAISVEMPTSAGKTLLAELSIVQTLALNPGSTIAYVVPTRALVNQITRRLRRDLQGGQVDGHDLSVESAVPVFQLDPTENSLLSARPDVLVSTPEKLDLLIRTDHPAVEDLSLVVVDEAHQISDASRGPRLELLLATLKRERGQRCRFLLLTPFLPNASELAGWLGDDNNAVVRVNWKPAEQLRAAVRWRRRRGVTFDVLRLVPSITQSGSWDQAELELGESAIQGRNPGRERVSTATAVSLAMGENGGVLVLTRGPGTAETRAHQIAEAAPELPTSSDGTGLRDDVVEYVRSELGDSYPLADLLRGGVAFHHAGLPPEVRALVEMLLERGLVRVVCGTSTLAQGVNFPLAAVIIETLKVPQGRGRPDRDMSFAEFWNVAGRAGRALKDPLGLVLYPTASPAHEDEFRKYLEREAQDVVSALSGVLVGLDQASDDYGLKLVREQPALSQFLQYLAHALRVAGYERAVADIEEILRSSLGFYRLQDADRETAQGLIRWSSAFLERTRSASFLSVADNTGFSLPSVGWMSANLPSTARDAEFWSSEHLFGDDLEPLTQIVQLLADVPELRLAPTDEPGRIDPRRVAGILRDWVSGRTLPEIADAWYPEGGTPEGLRRAGRYLFRDLTGQVPWGMGALQAVTGLSGDDSDAAEAARRAPAMAFYGVSTTAALNMRMAGVPRAAADVVGRGSPEFTSFAEVRAWVMGQPEDRWREAESERGVRAGVFERIWEAVGGTTA